MEGSYLTQHGKIFPFPFIHQVALCPSVAKNKREGDKHCYPRRVCGCILFLVVTIREKRAMVSIASTKRYQNMAPLGPTLVWDFVQITKTQFLQGDQLEQGVPSSELSLTLSTGTQLVETGPSGSRRNLPTARLLGGAQVTTHSSLCQFRLPSVIQDNYCPPGLYPAFFFFHLFLSFMYITFWDK